jgi:hypothetical protein
MVGVRDWNVYYMGGRGFGNVHSIIAFGIVSVVEVLDV